MILKATTNNILVASRVVKKGGLVVYPTDTVYGLGCDPFNIKAVERVFKLKSDREKPLPLLVSDMESVKKVAHLPRKVEKLAARFWPGPLTFVLHKKPQLPGVVTSKLNSVGVRLPRHKVAIRLIRLSGGFLIGTSANKTGEKPARTAREAMEVLGKEVNIFLDNGPTPIGRSSTVVDLTSEKPKILREGPISLEDILQVYPRNNQTQTKSGSKRQP